MNDILIDDIDALRRAFLQLQRAQRGAPEAAFNPKSNPGASNSAMFQYLMEHTGDLIHRAAYVDWGGGWQYGIDAIASKVRTLKKYALSSSPGNPDDVLEAARRNVRYEIENGKDVVEEEFVQGVIDSGERYAKLYEQLQPVTLLQNLGRKAAIQLGIMNWNRYAETLYSIASLIDSAKSEQSQAALYFARSLDEIPLLKDKEDLLDVLSYKKYENITASRILLLASDALETNLDSSLYRQLLALRPEIVLQVQKVYDEWEQNEEGFDEIYGSGGICDEMSEIISVIIVSNIDNVEVTEGGQEGDDHAFTIAYRGNKAFLVDISPSVYETGAGYSWKKKQNVEFTVDDIEIYDISNDFKPNEYI